MNYNTIATEATIIHKPKTRAERVAARESSRDGMLQAMRLAKEERRRLHMAKRCLQKNGLPQVPNIISDPIDDDEIADSGTKPDTNENDDSDSQSSNNKPEEDEEPYDTDYEPLRILQVGPYRWTPDVTHEYINQFKTLEGKLYAHPRTRRIYEITTVFFHPIKKIAAAYSRTVDGGQSDVHDLYPSRIEGESGLQDQVQKFEAAGGSVGKSKTKWPTSPEEWATELNNDQY